MGIYINKGNEGFKRALNGTYVDKTGMIAIINQTLNTERCFTCVTRCRRFGKTMAANMLCAYYDKSCHSRPLFNGLKIASDASFESHLNQYPVISIDMTTFTSKYCENEAIVKQLQEDIKHDVLEAYPDVSVSDTDNLMDTLLKIHIQTDERFIMIIDEWDAVLREFSSNTKVTNEYVNLLRNLFKSDHAARVFAGVYMTGILPIKKYKTQSALNNFREYSVVKPGALASYFGFTPEEVAHLATEADISIDDLKAWYDGYSIGTAASIFNPYSVMEAIANGECDSYWSSTAAYDTVSTYIEMNYEGLKDDIISMLAGGRCTVDTTGFSNDMHDVRSKNDVLTVLIHLGYLSYDKKEQECFIPNKEVRMEMVNAVTNCKWKVAEALAQSKQLLCDTLAGDEEAVAQGIERTHDSHTSILSYNNENSLACVLTLAYYHAMNDYIIHREMPTGKGFADLVFIPRRHIEKPAMVIELKYDKTVDTALDQIKRNDYPAKVTEYTREIVLVGINYDKNGPEGKRHTCKIERYTK